MEGKIQRTPQKFRGGRLERDRSSAEAPLLFPWEMGRRWVPLVNLDLLSNLERASGVLLQFKKLLKTKTFAQLVSSMTGLDLQAVVRGEYRKWEKQCYSLVQDCEDQVDSCGLDLLFGVQRGTFTIPKVISISDDAEWGSEHGGFTTYLDETTELLTLMPQGNLLALVFRCVVACLVLIS